MKRTTSDYTGEYYDNLDALIDISASGLKPYVDEAELKKMVNYRDAIR